MSDIAKFPRLETDRLILRMLTYENIDGVFSLFSDAEVTRYEDAHPVRNNEEAKGIIDWGRGLFEDGTGVLWGIFDRKSGDFMGEVNYVTRADNNFTRNIHRAEIGFDLMPRYWSKGYMTEALRSVIIHIFDNTGIDRIEAIISPDNTRSHNVVLRAGFKKEGVLRNYVLWDGKHWDFVLYSLLKHEWQSEA